MTALALTEPQTHAAAATATAPREVLTARLGEEEYAIDILAVQEIRRYEPATRIANAPAQVLGVMNLRGVIVPLIDLRHRLGLPALIDLHTVTIVTRLGHRTFGLVVDAVADVVALEPACIQPSPRLGSQVQTAYLTGLARLETPSGERLLQLVDQAALLNDL
jgi:purine-binding chemotaxis protein CheW